MRNLLQHAEDKEEEEEVRVQRDLIVQGMWNADNEKKEKMERKERKERRERGKGGEGGEEVGEGETEVITGDADEEKKKNSFQLDSTMYRWLLKKENCCWCSDLVEILKDNIDEDRLVVTLLPNALAQKQADMQMKRKALETFLLGADDDDISMLRTMVLTFDYQNGVEWTLNTPMSAEDKDDEVKKQKEREEKMIAGAIAEDRRKKVAEDQAALAHRAIMSFKMNVASKAGDRAKNDIKKKKLQQMMSKFRTVALTCVRGPLAGNLKFEPTGPQDSQIQTSSEDIDKEMSLLRKSNAAENALLRSSQWASILEQEITKAAGSGKEGATKKKKYLMNHKSLPACFGDQITSYRMAYKDIKRFKTKSVPALVRLACEVYTRHAEQLRAIARSTRKRNVPDVVFAATLYAHFLERYGLPEIADANMVGLAAALVAHRHKDQRLESFAQFCFGELNEHVSTGYALGITLLAERSCMEQELMEKIRPGGSGGGGGSGDLDDSVGGEDKGGASPSGGGPSSPKSSKYKKSALSPKSKSRRRSSTKAKDDKGGVTIPIENWYCSMSSIKSAMSKSMGTVFFLFLFLEKLFGCFLFVLDKFLYDSRVV